MPGGKKQYAEVTCNIHGAEEAKDQTRVKRVRVGRSGKAFRKKGCPLCEREAKQAK